MLTSERNMRRCDNADGGSWKEVLRKESGGGRREPEKHIGDPLKRFVAKMSNSQALCAIFGPACELSFMLASAHLEFTQ
jgi:hypothetical protein